MPESTLPRVNASIYDEKIPEHLREQFYADYPLLKKVYDFAARNYQLEGYEFPADGGLAIPPDNSVAHHGVELKSNHSRSGKNKAHAGVT